LEGTHLRIRGLQKPLSARLFLIPGKAAGEVAHFNDPFLTDSAVLAPQ